PITECLTADGDHPAVWLVVIAKVVLLRFSIHNIEEELLKVLIACPSPKRFHDVELQIAAETGTQFAVACETKLVAAFAEMKVGHCSDKADSLPASRNLVVRGGTVCSKLSFGNQSAITRFDHPLRFINRHEVFVIEHFGCAYRHHLDETEDQVTRRQIGRAH